MAADGPAAVRIAHPFGANLELIGGNAPGGAKGSGPAVLFCENETNVARLFGAAPLTPYPKDGINDHVTGGLRLRPAGPGPTSSTPSSGPGTPARARRWS